MKYTCRIMIYFLPLLYGIKFVKKFQAKSLFCSDACWTCFQMISAEAPVLFAKAAEIFIHELTMRAWIHTEVQATKFNPFYCGTGN
jgi:hypothetical protein